ncbi:MAG: glycosyltransferase [Bryobacterales bacterium]|nr:glycosyltransferase [Bryobacterales bacterium]
MRVAIVHYWLLGMRGGEAVIESLCRMFPDADLYTLFYDPERVSEVIRSHRVTPSYLNPLRRFYRSLLPWMPAALESFDLRGYDLVISSESGPAKGALTPASARHVCYCHTPMRYLWELYPDYLNEWTHNGLKRMLIRSAAKRLRLWDYASSARVDRFIANSGNVRQRIWKTYRRDSDVVYPPVAVETFFHRPAEDYFLAVAELVSYKRLEHAVRVFSRTGRKLRVVGDGPEYKNLKQRAGRTIEFCGRVPASELRELYARSRALIMPGEEDFGITIVEALASGKPVVGLARGGLLEIASLATSPCCVLYPTASEDDLEKSLRRFDACETEFVPLRLQTFAQRFSEKQFEESMWAVLQSADRASEPVPDSFV